MKTPIPPHAGALLSEDEALATLLDIASPVDQTEDVDTADGLGRVLAGDVRAQIDVPPADNSAMDGYAIASRDIPADGATLPVSQRITAGETGTRLTPGTAARIFTGAPIPPGADSVIAQEEARRDGDTVHLSGPVTPGRHIRRAGEDIAAGTTVLGAGQRLRPQALGLAASTGAAQLAVRRRVRVAMLCTGDELVAPGEALGPGQIYNSNRYTLKGLVESLGCEAHDLGVVPDRPAATRDALSEAAVDCDLVLSSGGVSVGEEDHVRAAVQELGELELWRLALKPGKPLAYGRIGATHFIGLPGNPVSLFVTFCVIARPFILRLQGRGDLAPTALPALAGFERTNPIERREYLRARLTRDDHNRSLAVAHPRQGSGVLSSTEWADCLAVVPAHHTVRHGQTVDVLPFSGLLW